MHLSNTLVSSNADVQSNTKEKRDNIKNCLI